MFFKILFCIFLSCFAMQNVFAQYEDFEDLNGKWKEISRSDAKGNTFNFQDTIRFDMRKDGMFLLRQDQREIATGMAQRNGKKLHFQNWKFSIVELTSEKLKIKDDEGIHELELVKDLMPQIVKETVKKTDYGNIIIEKKHLLGKWTCYKKTDPTYTPSKFYFKIIDIKSEKNLENYNSKITFNSSDSIFSIEAILRVSDNHLLLSADSINQSIKVLKLDGNEMILSEGEKTYFLKQFSK